MSKTGRIQRAHFFFSVIFSFISILKPSLNFHNHVCTKKSHRRKKKHFNLFFFSFFILSRILVSKNKPSEKPDIQTATFTTAGGVFLRKLFLFSANKKKKVAKGIFLFLSLKRQCIKHLSPAKKNITYMTFLRLQDGMSRWVMASSLWHWGEAKFSPSREVGF